MTTSKHDISHGEQTGARTESDPHETEFSRRAVLHLAGGVATLAAVSGVMAQAAAPGGQQSGTATRVRLVVNGEAHKLELDPREDRREDALRGVPPDAIRETVTIK